MGIHRPTSMTAFVAALIATTTFAHGAQDAQDVKDAALPEAAKILDRFVEVTGGADAHAKLRSSVMKGTLEFVGSSIKGPITIWHDRSGDMRTTIKADAIGRIEDGVRGDLAWTSSDMSGPRVLEGDERAVALRKAAFDGAVRWRDFYTAETVEGVEIGDAFCWKIRLTPKEGAPVLQTFDRDSGLLVRIETTQDTPMGMMPVTTTLSDWRELNGIRVPFTLTQELGDVQEVRVVAESLEHNVEIPAERFAPPESVRLLVEAAAAKDTEE